MIESAYKELFSLHHEKAWELPENRLISFFRTTDQTSAITGRRQAVTFQTLASLAGHGEAPTLPKAKQTKEAKPANGKTKKTKPAANEAEIVTETEAGNGGKRNVGLTVRIEVNLPQAADQETYDRIFRSIRENLLDAK